jgi:hypothetical protein
MSQLESLLAQLKQTLAEKGAGEQRPVLPASDSAVDPKTASAALKDFLSKTTVTRSVNPNGLGEDEARTAAASRTALSTFVGAPLGTGAPKMVAPGVKPAAPIAAQPAPAPSPAPVAPAPASAPAPVALAPPPAALEPQPAASSPPVQAAPQPTVVNKQAIAWFKHIQTVESALRIGDMHFVETLLGILMEIAEMVDDASMKARLRSLQARVKIENRQFAEAEALLAQTVRSLEGTPAKNSLGAAYCLLALAQCYYAQQKTPSAEKAQAMAAMIAEQCLGATNPEAKAFRQKLTA